MSLQIDLKGKRALVTGVSSGIGAAIARILAQAGCDVAGCGSRPSTEKGAQEFLESIANEGQCGHYFQVDLSSESGPASFVSFGEEKLGGIDIVISNAGRNIFKGTDSCSEVDWNECMNLDLASHWRLAKAAKPLIEKASPGVIVVIGSNHGSYTIPGCFPYNVAKAGLQALVQSLAIEWGPEVRSIGIAPGFIDTAGGDEWFNSFPDPIAERKRTEKMHPVGRIGSVDEIGALCAFLSTPYAAFISGTTLLVDGGRSALMQDS